MKKILIPIDYSDCANNALEYAIALAKSTGASLTVLNVYHLPVPAGEVPLMLISPAEILTVNTDRLRELENAVRIAAEGKSEVSSILRQGFAAEEIASVANEIKADLVVMGIKGSTSAAAILMGSVTTTVTKNAKLPVLVIPADARFHPIKKLAFAFDYKSEAGERITQQLKEYSKLFSASVQIVNIVGPDELPSPAAAIAGIRLDDSLADTPHRLYFKEGTDIVEELRNFIRRENSDWLIMIPHTYGFFEGLFHRSVTKRAAFHSNIPLLIIHQ